MNKGNQIKWSSKDADGEFSHIGVVTNLSATHVCFKTKSGQWRIPLNDGTFEVLAEGDQASLDTLVEVATPEVSTETSVKAPKEGSKIERAVVIVRANPNATRGELIKIFVAELNMSAAGASTYVHNARQLVLKAG